MASDQEMWDKWREARGELKRSGDHMRQSCYRSLQRYCHPGATPEENERFSQLLERALIILDKSEKLGLGDVDIAEKYTQELELITSEIEFMTNLLIARGRDD